MTIYEEAIEAGIPTDHHESDLYLPARRDVAAILLRHNQPLRPFRAIDGTMWYDVPFGYDPFWDAIGRRK